MSAPHLASNALLKTTLSTPSLKWALGGWSFFILENYLLSENRSTLIRHTSDDTYHIAYGALSTCAMTSVLYGYFYKVKDAAPFLWRVGSVVPLGARLGSWICLSLGLGMVSQMPPKLQIPIHFSGEATAVADEQTGQTTNSTTNVPLNNPQKGGWKVRCPFDFTDNKSPTSEVHGLERITRHPGLWSFGLLGLGNALLVPSLPQRVWLSMPLMVALVGGSHTDSRFRRGMGGTLSNEYDEKTSNVPFLAMLSGKQGNVVDVCRELCWEGKGLNAVLALGVAGVWVARRGRGVVKMPVR